MAEVSTAIGSSLDADKTLRRLVRLMVPALADWCAADLLEAGTVRRVSAVGREAGRRTTDLPWMLPATSHARLARVLLGAGPVLLTGLTARGRARDATHRRELEEFERLGADTAILISVRARGHVLGALTLVTNTPGRSLTEDDLPCVEELAHRVGLAIDNARLYFLQKQMAQRMQLSLLPRLPDILPLRVAARYAPARESSEVGGDWYDCFRLADGAPALVIGDIAGHDLKAAVQMSQVRNMTRALAWDRQGPPSEIVGRLDQALDGVGEGVVATMVLARVEVSAPGHWRLRWTNAGHPPPLLITRAGTARFLRDGHDRLLGVDATRTRPDACEALPPESTVLFYTDGLIERRTEPLDRGMTRLRQQTLALSDLDVETFCDKLLAMARADNEDDIAVIALRLPPPRQRLVELGPRQHVHHARQIPVRTIEKGGRTVARHTSEVRDGMRVDWDVPIRMEDGVVLRADVFRPVDDGRHPVIMTHGPYAKGLAFQDGYPGMWKPLSTKYPDAVAGTSNRYQNWETADPEKWVPDGYVCVRVDSRGAGRSPGRLDIFSPQETRDFYACIEWAGTQPWSNGKVGLLGISYYAANQWQVAALRPPHLAAICPWEGASDYYREFSHHGGILNTFVSVWYPVQVAAVQHGGGGRGDRNPNTGEPIAGPAILPEDELVANRSDSAAELLAHPFDDEYYRERSAVLEKITVPVLSATNWAHHLHTRGGFEGYARVSSDLKWLEVHGLEHFTEFYTDYGVALQKRFFGHFLKGEDTGWDRQPPVHLNVRHVDGGFELRAEQEWPLARTRWTELHLHPQGLNLAEEPPAESAGVAFEALGDGPTFVTEPFTEDAEITGPAAARLFVSSTTTDADLFLTLRVLDPGGKDVTFVSALDPAGVVGVGWLRASHRAIDPDRSLPYRPWHPHENAEPLTPGETVPLDIEIWPTSVVVPAGYRLAVTVQGRDFELPGDGPWPAVYGVQMRGNGMFVHTDPCDRPADVFGGTTTLVSGPDQRSYLLLPFIPRTAEAPDATRRGPFP